MAELTPAVKPTLIITRPPAQATGLWSQLTQVAAEQLQLQHLPLLKIVPLPFTHLANRHFDGAIFISRNAVNYFYQQPPPAIAQLCAIGDNTAASIATFTEQAVAFPQQMNAEGLLELSQLSAIAKQQWLVVKGIGGRTIISETLRQRGAQVTEVEVYQRKLPDFAEQKAIKAAQTLKPIWLITSAEALTNLHRILGLADNPIHATKVIISSNRLADLATQKGFTIFAQSAGASEIQLVQCVKKRFNIQD